MPQRHHTRRTSPRQIEHACHHCGTALFSSPSTLRKGKRHFCNRACRDKEHTGSKMAMRRTPNVETVRDALVRRIDRARQAATADGCWPWQGSHHKNEYGNYSYRDPVTRKVKTQRAHRAVYELLVGPIPRELELDHVRSKGCKRRDCVNPDHLEPVTRQENMRRAYRNDTP